MNFDLQLRDLRSGDTARKSFSSLEEVSEWLKARPPFMDVLGMASEEVPAKISEELKRTMRPLSDEERLLDAQWARARTAQQQAELAKQKTQVLVADLERLQELEEADENRPMKVVWRYNAPLTLADATDDRPLSPEVASAVEAWVAERQEWLKGRNQIVGQAHIELWPGEIPLDSAPGVGRVISGTFIPVSD